MTKQTKENIIIVAVILGLLYAVRKMEEKNLSVPTDVYDKAIQPGNY